MIKNAGQTVKQMTRQTTQANENTNEVLQKNQQRYTMNQVVGNGTFGMVYLATHPVTGEKVAIKKVFQDKRYKNREHLIIQELNHPCVIKLKEAYFTQGDKNDDVYLNLVMDYIPDTLSKVVRYYRKAKQPFPNVLLKVYSYQMFRALAYLEGIGICHRDIKPQNILIDPATHTLKICDFGSAKKLQKGEPNVAYICSRYYRAPELIFGATEYTTAIDVWSIGCVIAEMMIGEPLFPGESATDQLVEIIKILGTPTIEQVKQMNPQHKDFKFPQIKNHPWAKVFQKFKPDPLFVDLIAKLMVYPPRERLRPLEALMHPFFNEIREEKFSIPNVKLPEFFDFTKGIADSARNRIQTNSPVACPKEKLKATYKIIMNPVKVFPIKGQESSSPTLKRKPSMQQQPSERQHSNNASPSSLTPSKSRNAVKRYTQQLSNPTQEEKIRMVSSLTQKKLSLVQQPQSYSPKKRVNSTSDNKGETFFFKQQIQPSQDVRNNPKQPPSPPQRLPSLRNSLGSSTLILDPPKIDMTALQKKTAASKKQDTNESIQVKDKQWQTNKSSSQLLKLYDTSPNVRNTASRAKINAQTVEQDVKKSQMMQLHGRSTSQAALVSSTPFTDHDQNSTDIISLFISKSQAGQNGNKQTKTNQDSVIVLNNYGGYKNRYLFSVCDGHGVYGHYVSQLVKRVLPSIIDSQIKQTMGKQITDDLGEELYQEVSRMFTSSFLKMTKDLANCGIDITFSGSTCVTVFVSGNNLWCANIGDSRAIFIGQSNGKWTITELSNDHKPDLPSEKKRIQQCKGRVQPFVTQDGQPIGPARVWLQHDQIPGLAMSRSFGDYVASTVGVISEPEVMFHRVESKLGFLMVASDGIWEFITNEDAQKIILSNWTPNMTASKIDQIAELLVKEATRRWQEEDEVIDDISVVLAYVNK